MMNSYTLTYGGEILMTSDDLYQLKEDFRENLSDDGKVSGNLGMVERLDTGYLKSCYTDEECTIGQIKKLCRLSKEYLGCDGYELNITKTISMTETK